MMENGQSLIDAYLDKERNEAVSKIREKKKLEQAAIEAHKIRQACGLLQGRDMPDWDDMALISQKHFIEDARNVLSKPTITLKEIHNEYRKRLIEYGDTESEDLQPFDNEALYIEQMVLDKLKEMIAK